MRVALAIITLCILGFVVIAGRIMDSAQKDQVACADMRAGDTTAYAARIKDGHLPDCSRY